MLFTALIAPYYIDWASYKQDFERETSRILGQSVEVRGETKVRLLPLPSVSFGGLAIGTNPDNTPMMSVQEFAMDIELMPLLKGEIKIVKLNLVRPELNLHVGKNGEIAWTDRQQLVVDPEQIKLENFTVTNGEVNIHGLADGRTLRLSQLYGRITANSLYGPWRIGADGYIGDRPGRFDLVTGRMQDDGTIRVKLNARRDELPYKLLLDGPVQVSGGLLRWQGDYKLEAIRDDQNYLKPPLPLYSEGKFSATPQLVDIPEFRLEIGERDDPYTITGSGQANIAQTVSFSVKADGRQIDLDRLGKLNGVGVVGEGLNLEHRLGILRAITEKIPLPTAKGTIDLALPAIVAGDTLIRDIRALISPDVAGWHFKRLDAVFPGNTKLEAKGKLGLGKSFGFSGKMVVASHQPTGLAAWLGKRNNPFIRKLNSAGFSADVVVSDNQASFDNLEMILDAAMLEGKLQRRVGDNGRPELIAVLEGEQINLDDLRAIFALIAEDDAGAVTNHDLDISLKAEKLSGFDISAENVEARFRVTGGSVSVEKLNASNFFGATLTSSGRIDDLLKQPNGRFDLAVKVENPARLLKFVQLKSPVNSPASKLLANLASSPDLVENLDLNFSINARALKNTAKNTASAGSKGQALIKGAMGGTKINVEADFEGNLSNFGAVNLEVNSLFENENPAKLAMQLDLPVLPIEISGPLRIAGIFDGAAKDGFIGELSAEISGTKFKAQGSFYPVGKYAGDANFKITHSARDIAPMLILAGIGMPSLTFGSQAIPTSFTGNIELVNNTIILRNGDGQVNGREFSAELEFIRNTTSNHRVSGTLTASNLDLPLLAQFAMNSPGSADNGAINGSTIDTGTIDTGTNGTSGWSKTNFGLATLQGLDGEINLDVESSDLGLGEPANNLRGQLALIDGSFNLNKVKGEWMGGLFDANLSLRNVEGIGSLSAQFKFDNIDARTITQAVEAKNFIGGRLNISGDLEGSGRSPAAIVSSLAGSGTIGMKDVVISGVNISPLAHVFAAVDQDKFEIQDENVLPILLQVIDDGSIEAPIVSVPYVVAVGKFRARNITVETDGGGMVAAVEIDLKNRTQNSQLSVRFNPGKEWVEGADPLVVMNWKGAIKNPERSIDVQPLSGFLSLRNFEREQRRVDLLQGAILEKQRLRRDIIITNARVRYRQRLREEELRRQRQAFLKLEETRLHEQATERHYKLLAQERAAREEARRIAAEIERKRLEEEARIAAEIEHKRRQEEARVAAEIERKRQEEEARIAAELEHKRLEEEARIAAELELKRLEEEARIAAELERKRREEEVRLAAELERKRLEEEARRAEIERQQLAEIARIAEAERQRLAEIARKADVERKRLAEEARLAAEAEQKRLSEEARLAELERRRLVEEARKAEIERQRLAEIAKKAEAERKQLAEQARKAEAERKRLTEEARLAAEAEQKRLAEEARIAELERKRLAEEAQKAELKRKRLTEEARQAELEGRRLAEEVRKAELESLRLEEEVKRAESGRKRLTEEARKADAKQKRLAKEARIAAETEKNRLAEEVRKAEVERQRKQQETQKANQAKRKAAEEKRLLLAKQARRATEIQKIQEQLDATPPGNSPGNNVKSRVVLPDKPDQLNSNFAERLKEFLQTQ